MTTYYLFFTNTEMTDNLPNSTQFTCNTEKYKVCFNLFVFYLQY